MSRGRICIAAVIVIVVLVGVGQLRGPSQLRAPTIKHSAPGQTKALVEHHNPVRSVRFGPPGSASAVLDRFALAYADNTSAQGRVAASLAAWPLLRALMNAARLPGARAPGHGLTLVTRLLGLSLATAVSGRVSGSVVVRQQVIEHGRKLGAPTQNSYVATLVREAGEWKVSEYTLIP